MPAGLAQVTTGGGGVTCDAGLHPTAQSNPAMTRRILRHRCSPLARTAKIEVGLVFALISLFLWFDPPSATNGGLVWRGLVLKCRAVASSSEKPGVGMVRDFDAGERFMRLVDPAVGWAIASV